MTAILHHNGGTFPDATLTLRGCPHKIARGHNGGSDYTLRELRDYLESLALSTYTTTDVLTPGSIEVGRTLTLDGVTARQVVGMIAKRRGHTARPMPSGCGVHITLQGPRAGKTRVRAELNIYDKGRQLRDTGAVPDAPDNLLRIEYKADRSVYNGKGIGYRRAVDLSNPSMLTQADELVAKTWDECHLTGELAAEVKAAIYAQLSTPHTEPAESEFDPNDKGSKRVLAEGPPGELALAPRGGYPEPPEADPAAVRGALPRAVYRDALRQHLDPGDLLPSERVRIAEGRCASCGTPLDGKPGRTCSRRCKDARTNARNNYGRDLRRYTAEQMATLSAEVVTAGLTRRLNRYTTAARRHHRAQSAPAAPPGDGRPLALFD